MTARTLDETPAPARPLSAPDARQLAEVKTFFDAAPTEPGALGRFYRRLLARYYRRLIPDGASVLEIGCGSGALLALLPGRRRVGVDISSAQIEAARRRVAGAEFHVQAGEELELRETFDVIVISDTLNLAADVQRLFAQLQRVAHPGTRLLVNFHNTVWRPAFSLGVALGLKAREPQSSWLSTQDVLNLLHLANWERVKVQHRIVAPVPLLGLDQLANRWLAPLVPWLCLTIFCVARPRRPGLWRMNEGDSPSQTEPTVSVVIPARNEAGNIAAALERLPALGAHTEIIFVEGHSRDGTWAEIQRVAAANPQRDVKFFQQSGTGKGNAVREGFARASGDLLMILDADLTMPPEELPRFYEALVSRQAELANGVRFVYPMGAEAMRFLNLCGNKCFSVAFSWLLGQPVKDTLCGTKALTRANYERLAAGRGYFGEFDPFGDFDLLFGADKLNLKILDIPIRYQDRTYGTTNIHRWRHGALLLRMILFAAKKLKFV